MDIPMKSTRFLCFGSNAMIDASFINSSLALLTSAVIFLIATVLPFLMPRKTLRGEEVVSLTPRKRLFQLPPRIRAR